MSAPSVWNPPADVRAAIAAVHVREAQGSYLSDGRGIQLEPPPAVMEFARQLRARFPRVTSVGTRAGANHHTLSTTTGRRDVHEEGRAADAMADTATAMQVADYVSRAAQVLGVQGVICNHMCWFASYPAATRLRPYTGTNPHTDHAHLEVGPDAALWSPAQMAAAFQQADALAAQSGGISPWVWAAVAALGLTAAYLIITDD